MKLLSFIALSLIIDQSNQSILENQTLVTNQPKQLIVLLQEPPVSQSIPQDFLPAVENHQYDQEVIDILQKYDKDSDHHINWKEYRRLVNDRLKNVRLSRRQWQMIYIQFQKIAGLNMKMDPAEIDKMIDND